MGDQRVDVSSMYFEQGELGGVRIFGTGAAIDYGTIPDGYYGYDLFYDGKGDAWEHYFIMQSPLIAPAGAVITESPLEFGSGRWLGLENIKLYENKPLVSMEDLLGQKIQDEQIALPVEEEGTVMHLG